jgi:hypothetical protein
MSGARRLRGYQLGDTEEIHHRIPFNGISVNMVTSLKTAERSKVRELPPFSETSGDLFEQEALSDPWLPLQRGEPSDIKRDIRNRKRSKRDIS